MSRKRNEILVDLIELYKSEPCLWRVKSSDYHDKIKKAAAYEKLLKKYKELEPTATKDDLVKKINTLRSNVRKEKKKVEESSKSGESTDNIYQPTLWYYNLFDFLGDQNTPRASRSNLDSADDEVNVDTNNTANNNNENDTENNLDVPVERSNHQNDSAKTKDRTRASRPGTKTNDQDNLTNEVLVSVREHFKRPLPSTPQDDRYDLFGKTVAMKLRTLEKRQRLIAEKIINDALFEAEMGNLSTDSYCSRNAPQYTIQPTRSPTYIPSPTQSPTSTPSPNPSSMQQFTQFQAESSQNTVFVQLPSSSPVGSNSQTLVQLSADNSSSSSYFPNFTAPSQTVQLSMPENSSTSISSFFSNFDVK